MRNNKFCHLHVHTEHSYLDGFGKAKDYAARAKELGFSHLSITDHANFDGAIKFQEACRKENIKSLIGCEVYIVPDATIRKQGGRDRGHVTLLVKNRKGWINLCKIVNYANITGYYYRPRVDYDFLLKHCEGLVVMTACMSSFLIKTDGIKLFKRLKKKIKDDLYLEIMPHNHPEQIALNEKCYKLGKKYDVKMVATNDAHYIEKADWKAQEVLLAIQSKKTWDDKDRFKFPFHGLYLKTANEMQKAFAKQDSKLLSESVVKRAIKNTVEVAKKCEKFEIKKKKVKLPQVKQLKGHDPDPNTMLKALCLEGKAKKFDTGTWKEGEYQSRLNEELSMIKKKKFAQYFLIVWDLVYWCKQNEIMVGPGRGSVGGSLVAYLIGITTVDPIKYGLLFSRFITEDRLDYPDIDVDFEDSKRQLVRERLEDLYGEGNVFGVSTFQRMKSRAVIRDVSRVFGIPLSSVDEFAKALNSDEENSIGEAIKTTSEGRKFNKQYPQVVKLARKLEMQVRGAGQHAAAVVVSCGDVESKGRCSLVDRKKTLVANWEKNDAEYMGLMKLDILGLNALTILNEIKRLVKQNHDKNIDYDKINLDDKAVLREISKGNNVGVFQLGTNPMTHLIRQMGIESFSLIGDASALVRPGPADSGMTEEFIKRKKGASWERKDETYEEATKKTYGLVVYQEQVMAIIHNVGGLPYTTADEIRKVIGKKRDKKEFEPFRKAFVDGCLKNKTLSREEADEFWEGLLKHARYSFNLAHSTEYALLSYWMAWCKHHFSTEFICASLTYGSDGKKSEIVTEAVRLGLMIIPPKIGISDGIRWVAKGNSLYIPFKEVKGIGDKTVDKIDQLTKQNQGKSSISGFIKNTDDKLQKKFYVKPKKMKLDGKVGELLKKIGAYSSDEVVKGSSDYFGFDIPNSVNPITRYPKLAGLVGARKIVSMNLDNLLIGKSTGLKNMIDKVTFISEPQLYRCKACELRKECRRPVLPSKGKFNVAIVGEAPGKQEDKLGYGFAGKSGTDVLWPELKKYDLSREMFHVTNAVKCYPRISTTPNGDQIDNCRKWIDAELDEIGCRLILSFGNTGVKYFTGVQGGITKLNGTTTWSEQTEAWVAWCVHPASILYNPKTKKDFRAGIKNFVKTIGSLDNSKIIK